MSDFKETCIWMSYRYAIGRKSITSVMHASDIAQHIDWIPESRRDFTARDILNEVNDKINWMKNVHIDFYGKEECDVFSVVFEWFMNNPQEDPIKYFMDHEWHINLQTRQIHIEDRREPPVRNEHGFYYDADIFNDYSDYKGWVNLSKFIKGPTHIATVDFNNKIEEIPVIEWYDCSTAGGKVTFQKKYSKADELPGWYLSPEYITDIKKIEK